ncbi:MAG TPA: thioredoxin family protein [Acidimicrobiia bacterium]|nr:thioredoxin family protein [Acidimicrobiia bacterium]
MAVSSTMLPLGTPAPPFSLVEPLTGRIVSDGDIARQALLVMFICNHCAYVQHIRPGLVQLGRVYAGGALGIVAISANDPEAYPDDGPEQLAQAARAHEYAFPYLYDETQEVARAYTAACTPDFFLFDAQRRLAYRGRFDASRSGSGVPVTGRDLRRAIDAVLAGEPAPTEQYPSLGCSIKWRPGNEPSSV